MTPDAVALARLGRYDEALAATEVALRDPTAEVLAAAAQVYSLVGDYSRALSCYERALALVDSEQGKELWSQIGRIRLARGDLVQALHAYEQASSLEHVGRLRHLLGDYDGSRHAFDQALAQSADPSESARLLGAIGRLRTDQGEFDGGRECLERSVSLHRGREDRPGLATSLGYLGNLLLERGNLEGAERFLRESLEILREVGGPWAQAFALVRLGRVLGEGGRFGEAEEAFREGILVSRTLETPIFLADALRHRARLRLRTKDPRGRFDAEEALELSRTLGNPFEVVQAMTTLARYEKSERAAELIAQARVLLRSDANPRAVRTLQEDEAAVRRSADVHE